MLGYVTVCLGNQEKPHHLNHLEVAETEHSTAQHGEQTHSARRRHGQNDLISVSDFYDLLKSFAGFLLAGLEMEFEARQLGESFNSVPARCQLLITYLPR